MTRVVAPTMDWLAWLRKHLEQADADLLRGLVATFVQALMGAEADAACGAALGQRSPDRVNRRNGYRERRVDTRVGTIELAIPKLRQGSYFPDWLLERRRRAEQALITVVATSYLLGVSTRRVEKLVETLGVTRLSNSQVSEMAKSLDEQVAAFRNRPLDAGPYSFVWLDALALKVRELGRTVLVHALLAVGVNADGQREVLGLEVASGEDGAGWLAFLRGLVARGLAGVQLVTSDSHAGLVEAIGATLPGASWQRCRTHYARNLATKVPKSAQPWVLTLLRTVFGPARRHPGRCPVRPRGRGAPGQVPSRGRPLGRRRGRPAGLLCLPSRGLAAGLVQQSPGTTQPGDPSAHRRGRHLPRP
jgi:putative transposase